MSSLDDDEVGYGKPPRKHRFSVKNQPKRRRSKVPKDLGQNLLANILHALREEVSIAQNGKPIKATAGYIFARRLVKQGVGGTFNEQIKLANLLKSFGGLDPDNVRADIEKSVGEEHERELQEVQSRNAELVGHLRESLDLFNEVRCSLRVVGNGFLVARSTCSCGSFDDHSEAEQAIAMWFDDDDLEPESGAAEDVGMKGPGRVSSVFAPSLNQSPENEAARAGPVKLQKDKGSEAGLHGGDLADGMIGND